MTPPHCQLQEPLLLLTSNQALQRYLAASEGEERRALVPLACLQLAFHLRQLFLLKSTAALGWEVVPTRQHCCLAICCVTLAGLSWRPALQQLQCCALGALAVPKAPQDGARPAGWI